MNKIDTSKVAHEIESFKRVLSDERLRQLAEEHQAEDKRRRLLTLENFFWLMLLIHNQNLHMGGLGEASALLSVVWSQLLGCCVKITRMAISKQMRRRKWQFFQAVLEELKANYPNQVPSLIKDLESKLKDWKLVDTTAIDVARILKARFPSTEEDRAQVKLHIVFSAINQIAFSCKTTAQKCNDKRVNFVSKLKDQLYIFDLAYWNYKLLDKICLAGSYFISRMRSDCDPIIVEAEKPGWVGKKLSDILPTLHSSRLDLKVRLAKYRSNPMKTDVRLVGQIHQDEWHLFVTNLTDSIFTPLLIGQIYRVRWQIELLFNDLKHVINLDHIFSRSEQSIQVEIFSALIYYTLTRITIALAARQTDTPIEHFSFRRSARIVKNFLSQTPSLLLKDGVWDFSKLLKAMVELVILQGKKDTSYINSSPSMLPWVAGG